MEVNARMQIVVASCLTRVLTHQGLAHKEALIIGGMGKRAKLSVSEVIVGERIEPVRMRASTDAIVFWIQPFWKSYDFDNRLA